MISKSLKKFFSASVAMFLAAAMCSCSGSSEETSDTSLPGETVNVPADTAENTAASQTELPDQADIPPLDTSPITLSLFIFGDYEDIPFDDAAAEQITNVTGVTLDITVFNDETPSDVLSESEIMPDLIYAGDDTQELIENGDIIPVNDYVTSYGTNFHDFYGKYFSSLTSPDGNIYTFGTGGSSPAVLLPEGTFSIRHDVLEETGYPDIKTVSDLEACISEYMENHSGNTGLLLCGGPIQLYEKTISERVNYVLGYPNDGEFIVNEETGEASYKWLDPNAGKFIKWLNHMYNTGLLDSDSYSLKEGAYYDKISRGGVIAIAGLPEDYDDIYCPLSVTLDSGMNTMFTAEYNDYSVPSGIGITKYCSEPERAFRFLDWWCSDEAQDIIMADYDEENFYSRYAEPFPMIGITEKDRNGNYISPLLEDIIAGYSDEERATLDGYGIKTFADLFPSADELPEINRTLISDYDIPAMSEESILLETLETYMKTEIRNSITCSEEEFDGKWAEITEWCENNGAKELEELMTARIRSGE